MKSFLGMLFIVLLFIVVVGGGSFIWYLTHSAEFSRKSVPEAVDAPPPARHPLKKENEQRRTIGGS